MPPTLSKIDTFLSKKRIKGEIIVIDDGSTDQTARRAKESKTKTPLRIIRRRRNRGKGKAVCSGILAAKGDWILFTDADLSTPIEELETFLKKEKANDILIASRNLPRSQIKIQQAFPRNLLGKGFAKMTSLILGLDIKDTQCGFKLMRRRHALQIVKKMRLSGWAFDAELLYLAKKDGLRIAELPVIWNNSAQSKVNAFTAPMQMFRDILLIRYNDIRGKYGKK